MLFHVICFSVYNIFKHPHDIFEQIWYVYVVWQHSYVSMYICIYQWLLYLILTYILLLSYLVFFWCFNSELSSAILWTVICYCVEYSYLVSFISFSYEISTSCSTLKVYSWNITYISKYIFISNCCITWYVKVYYYLFFWSSKMSWTPLESYCFFLQYNSQIVYRIFLYLVIHHCVYHRSHVKDRWILPESLCARSGQLVHAFMWRHAFLQAEFPNIVQYVQFPYVIDVNCMIYAICTFLVYSCFVFFFFFFFFFFFCICVTYIVSNNFLCISCEFIDTY